MRKRIDNSLKAQPLSKDKLRGLYERAFHIINNILFSGELPCIKVEKGNLHDYASGLFQAIVDIDDNQERKPQIIECNIEVDTDETEVYGINKDNINILFHEMIHYYCLLHGIEDTDENDYHNLNFKKEVEAHGGKCEYDSRYGYINSKLPDEITLAIFNQV